MSMWREISLRDSKVKVKNEDGASPLSTHSWWGGLSQVHKGAKDVACVKQVRCLVGGRRVPHNGVRITSYLVGGFTVPVKTEDFMMILRWVMPDAEPSPFYFAKFDLRPC